jgi:hypothetical protein
VKTLDQTEAVAATHGQSYSNDGAGNVNATAGSQ